MKKNFNIFNVAANNVDLIKNFKLNSNFERYTLIAKNAYESVTDPHHGEHVSELGDLTNFKSLHYLREKILESDEGRLIISEKPRISEESVNFKNLGNLDKNTLGFRYYKYMTENSFTPNERPIVKYIQDRELSYVNQRYKETHDFYHVLLEMDRTLIDEVAVKWFEAEHLKLSSSSMGGLFGIMTLKPQEIFNLYNKLLPGLINIARNAKFLLGIYYEKRLEQDINDLRKELNIDLNKLRMI